MVASERKDFLHGLIVAIIVFASGFILPIIYASKMPDVTIVFPGIGFLTIGNYFIVKRKQFLAPIMCCLLAILAIAFGTFELLKNPIFSDGFNIYTFIVITIVVLLILAFVISIINTIIKNKKIEYFPIVFSTIAIILYAVVIEYIYSFMN